ncbi:MAG: hypothetical protein Hyperionvirus31_17 [Hyperionvirus sp.]|uniref:Uncharacterized protein n=1 Tax=Hyperionvirus sp. TaxID=2487770 RepID=A0A3G5ABU2_9VIRU|nr:MAG: hypothetical protein Hyperionvirus31_17 [Hyperionvirus sp.]
MNGNYLKYRKYKNKYLRLRNSMREMLVESLRNDKIALIRIEIEREEKLQIVLTVVRSMENIYLCVDERALKGFGKNKYQIFEYLSALDLQKRMVVVEIKKENFYFIRFSYGEEEKLFGVIDKILFDFLRVSLSVPVVVKELAHSDRSDELVQNLIEVYDTEKKGARKQLDE